jgi:hypothetical protein
MMKIYNLLKSNIKKGNFQSIDYLITEICTIINSTNIYNELLENKLIEWKDDIYNKKRIESLSSDDFDMYTISWLPEQKSPIHDHPQYGCIMFLISGTLEEKIYNKKLELVKTQILKGPYIGYIDNKLGFHSIKCIDKAVSLHIYSPGKYRSFLMSV